MELEKQKIINQELLKKSISLSKRFMSQMYLYHDRNYLQDIQMINKEICLVVAMFRCQKRGCQETTNLQLHHLITKEARKYMDVWRFLSSRYYWSNSVILCSEHHREYHRLMGKDIGEGRLSITEETIKKIKDKYFI